jgi:hypothetical protein
MVNPSCKLQKRMERLQMGGLAQSNDSVAVVSINNSRPGTPKTAKLADTCGSSPSALPAAPVPAPPATQPGAGTRSHRMRTSGSTAAGASTSTGAGSADPWQGSGQVRCGSNCQQAGGLNFPYLGIWCNNLQLLCACSKVTV